MVHFYHLLFIICLLINLISTPNASVQCSGERSLPGGAYTPGQTINVEISITGEPGNITVVEIPPAGWTVERILQNGHYQDGSITWILSSFTSSKTLKYYVIPPNDASGMAVFSGKVEDQEITGMSTMNNSIPFRFGTPINLGSVVNTFNHDCCPSISTDSLTLFFASDRPGGLGGFDLWVTTRTTLDAPWSEPVNLGPSVNSTDTEYTPSLSADGLSLYFSRGDFGSGDIWITRRISVSDPWGPAENLGSVINCSSEDGVPSISADGLSLFFRSMRPGGIGNTDIYMATRPTTHDAWNPPKNLGRKINSTSFDCGVFVAADALSLFIHSNRSGGFGEFDIYLSTRETVNDEWSIPVNLGGNINSQYWDICPNLTVDNQWFYFCDNPFGGPVRPGGYGDSDLWYAPVEPTSMTSVSSWKIYN